MAVRMAQAASAPLICVFNSRLSICDATQSMSLNEQSQPAVVWLCSLHGFEVSGQAGTASLAQVPQRRDESIDLLAGVVERESGAHRALQPEAPQNLLGAVMTAAYRDALAVEVVAHLFGAAAR